MILHPIANLYQMNDAIHALLLGQAQFIGYEGPAVDGRHHDAIGRDSLTTKLLAWYSRVRNRLGIGIRKRAKITGGW
jgi:hypothetical protein